MDDESGPALMERRYVPLRPGPDKIRVSNAWTIETTVDAEPAKVEW